MRLDDLIGISMRTVIMHKMRSFLTTLGIVVGIASVVVLTAIGSGIHQYVLAEFTQFGTNLIAVTPGKTSVFGMSAATFNSMRPLQLDDVLAIKRLDNVLDAVPLLQGNARIEAGSRQRRASVFGVSAGVPEVWKIKVQSGRFLPSGELRNPRAFAVLGNKLYTELFGSQQALGQLVRVGQDRFRVIGVMEAKGQMLGFDLDDSIYIPAARAMSLFNRQGLMEIDILYRQSVSAQRVSQAIKRLLIAKHGQEDFTLITQQQMLETLDSVLNILTLSVAALGGISLLVGAVGIITIMTVAVSERISEIGLLRAIGASRQTVFMLFLSEAIWLSTAGGILGITFGLGLVGIMNWGLPQLPMQYNWQYIGASLILSFIIGLLAGVLPASKAARLLPLEALREE